MNLLKLFKKIWPYVRPYRWLVLITLILTLIGSLMAQVNAIVLDKTVDAVNGLVTSKSFAWSSAARILTIITIVLLGKEILSALITFAQSYYGERMRIFVSKDLSQSVIDKMLTFRMAFFSRSDNDTGKLATRIDQGVSSLSRTVQNFFIDLLPLFTSAIIALVLMFSANVYVGLTALFIVPVYIWITVAQARKLKGWRRNMRTLREDKSHGVMNIIESISVIKSFNREKIESDKQWDLQTQFTDNQMSVRKTSFYYNGLKSFVKQVGTVLVIILTAYLVLIGYPGMTIGKIMYHVMLFSNVVAPITQLQRIFDDMNDALIYAEGFFDILDSDGDTEQSGGYRPDHVQGNFEISHVDFTYPNGTKALHDINMKIESGKITAFVGLSGAGKSTVVNLLDKFYSPDCGSITLDGVDLKEYDTHFLRENIGLVLQKNHIFDGSIEENIRYGRPDATFEEVVAAAKSAYIYDQIMELPEQFNNKAQALSGGQQQRIAIARAMVKKPPLILADEPTAALDYATSIEVLSVMENVVKDGTTLMVVTHNEEIAKMADRVVRFRNGQTYEIRINAHPLHAADLVW